MTFAQKSKETRVGMKDGKSLFCIFSQESINLTTCAAMSYPDIGAVVHNASYSDYTGLLSRCHPYSPHLN